MHFLMTALGSYGDVYPIVGLGNALRQRGHKVSIVTNPHFQSVVESVGVNFIPLGTIDDYMEMAIYPNIWHPIRGPLIIMKLGIVKFLRQLYEILEENTQAGETVLVAHCLDLASRVHQEKHGTPLASLFFAPMPLRSFHLSPRMGPLPLDTWLPVWLRRLLFKAADRFVVDRIIGPELNSLRSDLGLTPVAGILRDWYFSPDCVLGLFPEWFAPVQPDWPAKTHLTNFPLWDEAKTEELSPEALNYLDAGEPPIVFTPGSAMAHGQEFFAAAIEACELLGRRGLLVTKYPEQIKTPLPENVEHFSFVPFSRLLPRAGAIVHHGGIGTSAQGLANSLPQLIMPMAFDQFDNALRLERLGVAKVVRPKKFRGPRVAQALGELLENPVTQVNCQRWSKECDGQLGLAKTCEILESLGQRNQ